MAEINLNGKEDWMILGKFSPIRTDIKTWNDRRLHMNWKSLLFKHCKYFQFPTLFYFKCLVIIISRLSQWLIDKESACQCRRHGFDPWVGKIPWTRKWQPTPVFLPGKPCGPRSLAGCSPWGSQKEMGTT